jgi:putative hemolysin
MILLREVLVILGLIVANGFFAAAEIAIITSRRSRLEQQAGSGDWGSRIAVELARNPTRLLAVTQVGMTLVGTLAAVFGGAHLVGYLAEQLARIPLPAVSQRAESIALVLVVLAISFFSLVFGELVPKRLALANAERLARIVAGPMHWLAMAGRPVVWSISTATDAVLALLGRRDLPEPSVSIEDIEHLIKTGTSEGLLEPAEQMVARRALRLGDRTVREIMRPRIEIDALDVDTPPEEVIGAAAMAGFSRLPVHEGDMDHVIGFVYVKDLLLQYHLNRPMNLRKMVRPALLVPATMPIDRLLETFRQRRTQMAIVLDEFGGTAGMVTLEDVLEELVGEIHDEHRLDRNADEQIVARDARSWLVDAGVNLGDLFARLGWGEVPASPARDFSSVGGLVIAQLGRIPQTGDRTRWNGLDLEVVEMDGPRLDRILVTLRDGSGKV